MEFLAIFESYCLLNVEQAMNVINKKSNVNLIFISRLILYTGHQPSCKQTLLAAEALFNQNR